MKSINNITIERFHVTSWPPCCCTFINRVLRGGHLTFEGEDGRISLYKIFFSLASGAGNFFTAVHVFFLGIRVA